MKYAETLESVASSTCLPSALTALTERGCKSFLSSLPAIFMSIIALDIFNPPAVEPAQPPISISVTIMVFENVGHAFMSVTANPVVVIIEDTWNAAVFTASESLAKSPLIFQNIRPVLTSMTET